jgi:hypothetical protein
MINTDVVEKNNEHINFISHDNNRQIDFQM